MGKLREAEIVLAQGGTVSDAFRRIGVTEQTYYRWPKQYGGLKVYQAQRLTRRAAQPTSWSVRMRGCDGRCRI